MTATAKDPVSIRRDPPSLSDRLISEALQQHYGLDAALQSLSGERSQNLRIETADGKHFVARIANLKDSARIVDLQTRALQHLARQDASLPVPAVVCDNDGRGYTSIIGDDHKEYLLHVLEYMDGDLLADRLDQLGGATFRQLGSKLAMLDRALRGFFHPAADHRHPWNMEHCHRYAGLVGHQDNKDARKLLGSVFEGFERVVLPRLRSLRHQVIHQDAHFANVIVAPGSAGNITGIIDFGDMTHGSLVAEIAIACDVIGRDISSAIEIAAELVAGYDAVTPLEEEELDLLFDTVVMRNALIATIADARKQLAPDEHEQDDKPESHTSVVDRLLAVGRSEFDRRVRRHSRFPVYCPRGDDPALDEQTEEQLIADRRRLLGEKTTHFYKRPLHFERAEGALLFGADGRDYLDCYNNVPQVGHCNPHVVRAIGRQAGALNTNTRYLFSSVLEYADRLTAKLAPHLDACVFVNSGSEANDVAWQMAQRISGRSGAILMEDAYHGVTEVIREFSPGHPDKALPPHLRGIAVPDPYRGPIRDDVPDIAERYAADAQRAIGELEDTGYKLAAFMIDSAFCSSGVPEVPATYLQQVEKHVRTAGGLMICDEVQSGFGRMGQWWGHEYHGVRADFVTMGKPVANGHPFGVVVTSSEILNEFIDQTRFFSTFGGNTVSCAAANAVLDVIEREELIDNGNWVGDYLRSELKHLANRQELIGNIRGDGMLTGLEFVTDREARTPATAEVARLLELMRERQVLVGSEGRDANILKLRPPLVFERQHVDRLITALDDALGQL